MKKREVMPTDLAEEAAYLRSIGVDPDKPVRMGVGHGHVMDTLDLDAETVLRELSMRAKETKP